MDNNVLRGLCLKKKKLADSEHNIAVSSNSPEIFIEQTFGVPTLSTLTTSAGNVISGVVTTLLYMRSTNIPARMACATDLNLGFSSPFLRVQGICLVNVDASHSRTSCGTASGCTSDSSSSSSAAKRLQVSNPYVNPIANINTYIFRFSINICIQTHTHTHTTVLTFSKKPKLDYKF